MKWILSLFAFFFVIVGSSQKILYPVSEIPEALKENANAVLRQEKIAIVISSRRSLNIETYRAVTILNEYGLRHMGAYEGRNVESAEAVIYDAFGKEIKRMRRKDFKEMSVSEGYEITDNKLFVLEYAPSQYPFTIVYQSSVRDSNTAFIPSWFPADATLLAVENASVSVTYPVEVGFRYKEYNFGNSDIKKEERSGSITYTISNLLPLRSEQLSPSFRKLSPHVMFALEKFHLEGVDGDANTWASFGSWNYNILLNGTDELSPETQAKIKMLVGDEKDPLKKARIIYNYVQDRTRYVSIQLGIGGWRPMKAKDVDRLGYGDCKALTNYTRALLNVVGVRSYYTIINADEDKIGINSDFVSLQGNHVVLGIPSDNKITWLECTSQISPFGYQGISTDDRLALLVKPEGGELVRTTVYNSKDNLQTSTGKISISDSGALTASIEIHSKGLQYGQKMFLDRESAVKKDEYYKEFFSINNLKLEKSRITNNKEKIELIEEVTFTAPNYANASAGKLIIPVNAFNKSEGVPQRYRNRSNPLEIPRGFTNYDEIMVELPDGYTIEARPDNFSLKDKFGEYSVEFIVTEGKKLLYKRTLTINEGVYDKAEYDNYRKFREQIARMDNAKMILTKT
ncbi:MAG TPA: DUF3858 domain-containing protein [Flavobacterium sp.]|jgi:citrate lyase gamma subunit